MCGRYSLAVAEEKVREFFKLVKVDFEYVPRYNIAPGQEVPVIIGDEMVLMKWGLVPFWAQDEKMGYRLINARAETIAEKPSFRDSFARRRCIVPADGFYEWLKEGKEKKPFRFVPKKGLFALAGIWDTWKASGEDLHSFSIATCEANEVVSRVHERMPVILSEEARDIWLDNSIRDKEMLLSLLKPYHGDMDAYEVSSLVNKATNDEESVIERIRFKQDGLDQGLWLS